MLSAIRPMFLAFWATVFGRLRGRPRRHGWPFVFEVMVRFLRLDWDASVGVPYPRQRVVLDGRPYPRDFQKRVRMERTTLGGVPATRFVPPGARPDRRILYLHGGSYAFGSARTTHGELIARLAFEARTECIAPDYRLAPEHVYPAQLDDAKAAFDALVASGVPADAILVAGDSAGGNLALALQLALRDRGGPQARAAILVSPWCDLEMPGASYVENAPFDYGTRVVLHAQAVAFAGSIPLSDARVSPANAPLEGIAPTLVTLGGAELLRDDIHALVERLRRAGVEVAVHVAADLPHNGPFFAAYHPQAADAVRAITAFVDRS